jgi:hypothetical protein
MGHWTPDSSYYYCYVLAADYTRLPWHETILV